MTARPVQISPAHPVIREYHRSLTAMRSQGVEHESALRHSFQNLLADSARLHEWNFMASPPACGLKPAPQHAKMTFT
ncbi:MAG: hypothetical protein HY238_26330 [Acidobacteria bacterium]|nr:hypothetical protein [Acidobacteriota bacterium]